MEATVSTDAPLPGPFAFQVSRSDLGPLFVDTLRLEWNASSPLQTELAGYVPGSGRPSDDLAEVTRHPLLAKVAPILARPTFRMLHRTGGSAAPASHFAAYNNRNLDADAIVTVTPSFEGSLLIQLFDPLDDYCAWWSDLLAAKVEGEPVSLIPESLPLESFVYFLHAIDAYRRASYQSMLDYAPTDQLSITAAEFTGTMARSLRSRDLRWLLPAFLHLVPGLDLSGFDPREEHLAALSENDFLLAAKETGTGEPGVVFGEAGRATGIEFHRTWLLAVGFELAALSAEDAHPLSRGFLAPTGLANHLFLLESVGPGRVAVRHEALSADSLRARLQALLAEALAGPAVAGAPAAATQRPGPRSVCPSCQARVSADARFCPSCGQAVPALEPALPAYCPKCGTRTQPGGRFCVNCGEALSALA